MKISIKTYKYEKVIINDCNFELPENTCYFFETGVRRSIKIVPVWTTWNKENGKEEEIWSYDVTCVYRSFECKIEKFSISVSSIEELYQSKGEKSEFIYSLLNNYFQKRTEEQFNSDLKSAIKEILDDNKI